MLKNEKKNTSKVVENGKKGAKLAKLDYEVIKYDEEINLSVIKVNLHTGRHHQIRVQLSHAEHSIYGDQKYGVRGKGKQIALWAYSLKIIHPVTKEEMTFTSFPEKIRFMENIRRYIHRCLKYFKLNSNKILQKYNKRYIIYKIIKYLGACIQAERKV